VGVDRSTLGGCWNGPVESKSGEFAYVAIPETNPIHTGTEKPYTALSSVLSGFGVGLPAHLRLQHMHLDPDFEHLTYGDRGERAKQLRANLEVDDTIAFYSALADGHSPRTLVYAVIGLFVVQEFILAGGYCGT